MNLLLVDDEPEINEILKETLKSEFPSAKFECVEDGTEALIAITDKKFDLVVTDYKMRRMNGIEFLNNMQNIEASKNKDTPAIIFSGFIPQVTEQMSETSTILFEHKPLKFDSLARKVKILTSGS